MGVIVAELITIWSIRESVVVHNISLEVAAACRVWLSLHFVRSYKKYYLSSGCNLQLAIKA